MVRKTAEFFHSIFWFVLQSVSKIDCGEVGGCSFDTALTRCRRVVADQKTQESYTQIRKSCPVSKMPRYCESKVGRPGFSFETRKSASAAGDRAGDHRR